MIASTQAFADRISGNARQHRARFLLNGEPISGDIKSVIVQKGSCGESAFSIGAVYSSALTAQIDNCTASLEGQELDFQMGLLLEDDNEDSVEYISIGCFVVTEAKASTYSVNITGSGRIAARCSSVYVPGISFPATIGAVLDDLAQQTECPIDASAFSDMLHLTIEKRPTALLQVEMLGVIAGLFGGYVTESNTGVITFAKYSTTPTAAITADQSTQPYEFSEKDAVLNGIRVTVSEDVQAEDAETETEGISYEYGTPDVTLTNEYMTQEIFNAMVGNIVGYSYRPANMTISLGDIRLEAFDVLLVRDSAGMAYTVPCMSVLHAYDGGVSTTVIAPDRDAQQEAGGLLTRTVERMSAQMGAFEKIVAGKASITELEAVNALMQSLKTTMLTADSAIIKDLGATYARIDFSNVGTEAVRNLFVNVGMIEDATIENGKITGTLSGVRIVADVIEANAIVAGDLLVRDQENEDIYYKINIEESGITREELEKKEYEKYINGEHIVAKSITASQIASRTITGQQIAAGSITAEEIAAYAITAAMIAFGDTTLSEVLGQTIETQAVAQRLLDSINLRVSSLSQGILNTDNFADWIVTEAPTMTNYPVATDFYIWSVCANDLYCADDLLCGTADFENHLYEKARDTAYDTYYVFVETDGVYRWRTMTASEIEDASQSFGSVTVDKDEVQIRASKNGSTGTVSMKPDGLRANAIYCC